MNLLRRHLAWLSLVFLSTVAQAQSGAEQLFAVSLSDLQDKPQALAQWQGKPLIVNFWARWCGPCRTEIPELIKIRKQHQSRGLEVLGIALEYNIEPVRDFAKAYEMDYPVLVAKDQGFALMKALGNAKMGLPFTVAIDRSGKVVVVRMGAVNHEELLKIAEIALR